MSEGPTRESDTNKSNLELGDTRDNKRALIIVLSAIHLFSFVGIITLLAASTQFSWTRGLVAVLAVVIWLFSFILLFVNAMSYFFAREAREQQAEADAAREEGDVSGDDSGAVDSRNVDSGTGDSSAVDSGDAVSRDDATGDTAERDAVDVGR